jgi:quinol monooxygenase YgiN
MHIVHVYIQVKPERVSDFINATLDNARNSVREPGIKRFDVIQQQDDPTRFVLCEVYRDVQDVDAHKQTEHYLRWLDKVTDMMPQPRTRNFYHNVFPEDAEW